MQEDNPDTQGGDPIEGQGLGEEIAVDKDCLLGIEFPFDEELVEKPRKLRAHLTRAEKRRHNQQWTRPGGSTTTTQLKKEQEEDPEVQRWMTQEDPTRIKCIEGVLCCTWSPSDLANTAGCSFIFGGTKPVDTAKREPEIEERLLQKQE